MSRPPVTSRAHPSIDQDQGRERDMDDEEVERMRRRFGEGRQARLRPTPVANSSRMSSRFSMRVPISQKGACHVRSQVVWKRMPGHFSLT